MITVVAEDAVCPKCGEIYIAQCRCPLGDRMCRNGHHWHKCPECGTTCSWEADHGTGTKKNLCSDCQRKLKQEREKDE